MSVVGNINNQIEMIVIVVLVHFRGFRRIL